MPLSEEYLANWKKWNQDRVDYLNRPYGHLSMISQDWLTEGEFFESPFVPGKWLLEKGEIYYHPDAERLAKGDFLVVDGNRVSTPTHIPHRHKPGSTVQKPVPVFYKDIQVETSFPRLNERGEDIYAIRVRDPNEARRKRISHIDAFPPSEEWIVPAEFHPSEVSLSTKKTVEETIYEETMILGTLQVQVRGQNFSLEVNGHVSGTKLSGLFLDGLFLIKIGDQTNGKESYGGGRQLAFDSFDDIRNLKSIDLNRLESNPCSFTTFMTCPTPPLTNRMPFRVTAGEHVAPIPHERVPTYRG